jgi:asparagine synthase (glutamine-hydrolysing)
VLLNGEMGDQLFSGGDYWLRDLIVRRRFAAAARRIANTVRISGAARTVRGLRAAVARVLSLERATSPPPWLTGRGAEMADFGAAAAADPTARRIDRIVDRFATFGLSREITTASVAGIDVRRPYRDRRLVELAAAMPAHLVCDHGVTKWILREAGRGLLPERVRMRQRHSTLLPLFSRGLADRQSSFVRRLLDDPGAPWRPFVSSRWLDHHLAEEFPTDSAGSAVIWQCLTLHLWHRAYVENAGTDVASITSQPPWNDSHLEVGDHVEAIL